MRDAGELVLPAVAAWVELQGREGRSAPTIKQQLAGVAISLDEVERITL